MTHPTITNTTCERFLGCRAPGVSPGLFDAHAKIACDLHLETCGPNYGDDWAFPDVFSLG